MFVARKRKTRIMGARDLRIGFASTAYGARAAQCDAMTAPLANPKARGRRGAFKPVEPKHAAARSSRSAGRAPGAAQRGWLPTRRGALGAQLALEPRHAAAERSHPFL